MDLLLSTALDAAEAAALLQQRRDKVAARYDELDQIPVEMRELHPGIEYLIRFFRLENAWLDEIIAKLKAK